MIVKMADAQGVEWYFVWSSICQEKHGKSYTAVKVTIEAGDVD